MGAEFQWRPASLGLQGEFIQTRDQRFRQGIEDENLPDALARGWYASGTWLLTGERKTDSVEPARPLFHGGIGAVELVGRVEVLDFQAGAYDGLPAAAKLFGNRDRAATIGVNWYLNHYIKIQGDMVHEAIDDATRSPAPLNGGRFTSSVILVQFRF
jgi:phosphate-selective porin OprO/OprP